MKKTYLLIIYFIIPQILFASNYYWVGGTGNWSDYASHWASSSGGIIFHTTVPSPLDDVFFDSNSFPSLHDTVYADTTLTYCHDMNWTGAANNPVLAPTSYATIFNIYGSLTFINNMDAQYCFFDFLSASSGNTITSAGQTLGGIFFNGFGGTWALSDKFSCVSISLNQGTFISNDHHITCSEIYTSNSTTMLLGNSVISFGDAVQLDNPSLTLDASNADFVLDSVSGFGFCEFRSGKHAYHNITFDFLDTLFGSGGSVTFLYSDSSTFNNVSFRMPAIIQNTFNEPSFFHKVTFMDDADIENDNLFDTLFFNNAGKNVNLLGTQTINDALIVDGTCSQPITIQSSNPGSQAVISKSSGSVILSFLILKNIQATGGATFIANNSFDLGNNSGITINSSSSRTMYWIGGTGNWNDPSHWSLSSGGTGGNCMPSSVDDVYFDANSFIQLNDYVYLDDNPDYCRNMNWSGATLNPVIINLFTGGLNIYGSLTLIHNMIWAVGFVDFLSSSNFNSITSAGQNIGTIYFDGSGGTWSLSDSLLCYNVSINQGTFISNDNSITCQGSFTGRLPASIQLGNSTITVSDDVDLSVPGLIVDADSADFILTYSNSFQKNFYAGSHIYHNISFYVQGSLDFDASTFHNVTFFESGILGGSINGSFNNVSFFKQTRIGGNNSFDTLLFNNPGYSISLSHTQTIFSDLEFNSTCNLPSSIQSSNSGFQAILSKSSGNVDMSNTFIKDIYATGGASFVANNSFDFGNNSGILINTQSPRNLFWVGGTGYWNDPNHWSLNSGGANGNCIPSILDNVFFDQNSFLQANDTVYLNLNIEYCKNLDCSGVTNNPVIDDINSTINIYGSLTLSNNMLWMINSIHFLSTMTGNTITSAGQNLRNIFFDGVNGGWSIQDDLLCGGIDFSKGYFNSQNFNIDCYSMRATYYFDPTGYATVFLGNSTVTALDEIDFSNPVILDAGNTDFIISSILSSGSFFGGKYLFHNITFYANAELFSDSSTFNDVIFLGEGDINGSHSFFNKVIFFDNASVRGINSFDTLYFNNPGNNVIFADTQTVKNVLWTGALPGFPINIHSSSPGTPTVISAPPGDTICLNYLYLQDINVTGGAAFFAGDQSVDLGNNSGWNWSACTPYMSDVWPGDANYDLIVDNLDLLNIGVAYGETGSVRPGASLNYIAQPCTNWNYQFLNGTNLKHSDCDGNGIVNASDTTAIILNYGQAHPLRSGHQNTNAFGADLRFQMPAQIPTVTNISIPITLGTIANPANNVYGVAFSINYDPAFIQSGSMYVEYTGSWIESSGNHLHLEKDFPSNGKMDVAFTRLNHADVSGNGIIATLHLTLSNNASGYMYLSFSRVKIISHNEIDVPVNKHTDSSLALPLGINSFENDGRSFVYPNPMRNETHIYFNNPNHDNYSFLLTDITGRLLYLEKNIDNETVLVERKNLSNGVYFYSLKKNNEEIVVRGKIIIE